MSCVFPVLRGFCGQLADLGPTRQSHDIFRELHQTATTLSSTLARPEIRRLSMTIANAAAAVAETTIDDKFCNENETTAAERA